MYLQRRKDGPFGKEFPVSEAPTTDGTSGYPSYAEGSDELDGEDFEVIYKLIGHSPSCSPIQPPAKKFHRHLILSTPKNFQPVLSSVPSSVPPPHLNAPLLGLS
ncbi:hypothetical protein O181_013124 [Austropuccinia psidii MF-1]|uniref:Uncharacterized protein n=1 Tax=Austropuccinia psidii MF-1 TaxID=1389203 RepID=A0A9Q3GNJ0_9BASI|nr:hypothetical protein [Austropuccinia psidii MF-1]